MIDFRFDPFLFVFKPKNITGEVRTVQHFPAFNRVGFFLGETPQRLTTAPVSVICAGDTLGEVSRLATPGVDNFRVDYGNVNNFAQAGFVEIHASRAGQVAVINYRGLGVNLNASLRTDARKNLQRSVNAPNATAPALAVTGSLDFGATLSAGMQRIRDLTTLTATDLLSLSALLGLTGRTAPQILTGSGYWAKPANVHKVFFVLVGPGGSGHVDGGGGGGGASVYGVADLDAIGGNMFAYVCGVVGIATTMFGCVAGAGSSAPSGGSSGGSGGTGSVGAETVGRTFPGGDGSPVFYVAVGQSVAKTSYDGQTWTAKTPAENNQWMGLTYGGGLFVAVARTGTNRVMTSPDGVDWTARSAAENNEWAAVVYAQSKFVAVAGSGTNRVMTSPDGVTWTPQSVAEANAWAGLTYGGGLFVAVAGSGTNRVMTSPDAVNWTPQAAAEANSWMAVAYGNGVFVAVSNDGTNRVMTSTDGATWTPRSVDANLWTAVTYANGLFVAVSADGANRVMTSADGATWTPHSVGAYPWEAVTYGNGLFVAVAGAGSDRAMTSTDGATWTDYASGSGANWMSVVYAPIGAGGGSGGGLGGNGNDADCGKPGKRKGFFSGSGGDAATVPESFGGGAGAGGTGADGLILLVY